MLGRSARRRCLAGLLLLFSIAAGAQQPVPTKATRPLFEFAGGAAGPMVFPTDVAVGTQGRVYVVDGGNHRIVAFGVNGQYLFSFGRHGEGHGEFNSPVGVGTDPAGRVYVADSGNNRIQIFDGQGGFQGSFPVVLNGKPARPIDVAANAKGDKLFVTSNTNHRVMVFSPSGSLIRHWGGGGSGDGEFRYPATVTISRDGLVHVVDVLNTRVQVFDEKGGRGYRVGDWGVLAGQLFRPKGVGVDEKGRVYVSDSYMEVIQVFDTDYRFMHVLGEGGKPQRFKTPVGITVDGDRLYVVEQMANKVSVHALP